MFGPWPGIISNYGCGTFPHNLIIGSGLYNTVGENDFPIHSVYFISYEKIF